MKLTELRKQYNTGHLLIAFLSAITCLILTIGNAFMSDFDFNIAPSAAGWRVTEIICVESDCEPTGIEVGDLLVRIEDISLGGISQRDDALARYLYGGDDLEVEKITPSGERQVIMWNVPPTTPVSVFSDFLLLLFVAPFWYSGALSLFYSRGRAGADLFAILMFGYVVWFASGLAGPHHILHTTLLMRALSWMLSAVAIHFHWVCPSPSLPITKWWRWRYLYAVSILLVFFDIMGRLGANAYLIPILVQIVSILALLVFRYWRWRAFGIRMMLVGFFVSFSPGLVDIVLRFMFGVTPSSVLLALFIVSFLAWPFFYTYALFHQQLKDMEARLRHVLTTLALIILYFNGLIFIVVGIATLSKLSIPLALNIASVVSIFTLPMVFGLSKVGQWSDRYMYGRVNTKIERAAMSFGTSLVSALHKDDFLAATRTYLDSLGIEKWALYETENGRLRLLISSVSSPLDSLPEWYAHQTILEAGEQVGYICLGAKPNGTYFDAEEERLLAALGAQIAAGLRINRLHNDVREQMELKDRLYESMLLQQKMAALGKMAGHLAHEIMTPLQTITSDLDIVLHTLRRNTKNHNLVERAAGQVNRVAEIVRNIRSFARPSADLVEEVDVASAIRQALGLCEAYITHTAIQISAPSDAMVLIASSKLVQVLTNLIINACQAMGKTADPLLIINVTVSDGVEIEVTDNGEGIAKGDLPHLFDPFFTTKREGLGLGLSVCFRIMEEARGRIRVITPPVGSTFIIWLPKVRSKDDPDS